MALVSDGSRICDANRVALAAIDASVVLPNQFLPYIYATGVDLGAADSMTNATGHHELYWRIEGGTFALIETAGQVKRATTGTVLVDFATVTNGNKRTTQTATSTESLVELEGTGGADPNVDLIGEVSSETQQAFLTQDAIPGAAYEMRLECVHTLGTTNIDYAAKIHIPIFKNDYTEYPKQVLRR